ncbi:MAG TPA: phosphate regulon transcriptional regulatory protein PhoB [Gammaproteobacteria bacterium]|jgi:two-component system, OmpR family, phosphate regulon response regulator PhoB|nr:phosphate regulon transcriptional regulator PhoB [Pseudomonadota bacterium]HAY46148.1 phosphate regulon transcriptional regulatory protein PhoB [Gammaproteobacteria bacterium]
MKNTILIVDDESAIRDMVRMALENADFQVFDAASAHQAEALIAEQQPDIILLDWMMPGVSGLDFARKLKNDKQLSQIGIIMLTARTEEDDRVRGLDIGADDFISKPFSTRELISRVNALLRRIVEPLTSEAITSGRLQLDTVTHQVTADKQLLNLSPTEFKLLHFFMSHAERVFSRVQLLDNVWGENIYVEERTVDVHIRRLRKVLQRYNCEKYIKTVRSVGYRFSANEH